MPTVSRTVRDVQYGLKTPLQHNLILPVRKSQVYSCHILVIYTIKCSVVKTTKLIEIFGQIKM